MRITCYNDQEKLCLGVRISVEYQDSLEGLSHEKISSYIIGYGIRGCADPSVDETTESVETSRESAVGSSMESISRPEEEEETVVSFMGVGDNLIHGVIYKDAELEDGSYDFKPMFANITEEIEAADLAFINQETLLGGDEFGFSGYPAFNTPSDMAKNLNGLGFDLVNGSTNHSLDKGTQGVLNTLDIWEEQEDILFTGVFKNEEHRDTIPVIERDGLAFSFLAYTYGTNGIEPDASYRLNYFDEATITQDIQRAKEMSDFVIVSAHWGDENVFEPTEFQTTNAQLFADLGVDVVIGTHPHVIQPVEWVEGKKGNETLVVYSLGNFLGSMVTEKNTLGGMISFDFVSDGEQKTIENVDWTSTVIHYEADPANVAPTRRNFVVYPLEDYTEELAEGHAINGYKGNMITKERFQQMTEDVIDAEFLE